MKKQIFLGYEIGSGNRTNLFSYNNGDAMMKLDFSKCKTPEDVEDVFAEHKKEFDAIKKGIASLRA